MILEEVSCGHGANGQRNYTDAREYAAEQVVAERVVLYCQVSTFGADRSMIDLDDDERGDERTRYYDDQFSGSLPKLISCHGCRGSIFHIGELFRIVRTGQPLRLTGKALL